jgi:hypothetical protein
VRDSKDPQGPVLTFGSLWKGDEEDMKEIVVELGRTVRYSLAGWARTVRLCVILVIVVYVYHLIQR